MRCVRLVEALVGDKIEYAGWQFIPEQMVELGLTAEDGMLQVWYVSAENKLSGGAEAINHTLRHVWYLWPFTWLYYVPGVRQLQDRAYRWVADNRYKMPGSTDACAVDLKKVTSDQ